MESPGKTERRDPPAKRPARASGAPQGCAAQAHSGRGGRNSQLSAVLHLLLHLAEQKDPVTSGVLAKSLGTNPVVIRRILAGLRTHGYVASDKGHGGGWMLACRPDAITLRDIYVALGCPSILALDHWSKSPGCLVEQAVNDALNVAFQDASLLLLERLGEVTLATLHAGLRRRTTRHHSAKAQS